MKRVIILAALVIFIGATGNTSHAQRMYASFDVFYTSLSAYGEWIDTDYGFVWRPLYVKHGWRPYLDGRWAWTANGWYWMSYEPFGWATFHYGRWYYDDYYGWIWFPGNEWGPAWVEWRYDNDYIGWAPLPPYARFNIRFGVSFSFGWIAPHHYWNFVSCRHFGRPHVVQYVQPIERVRRIFGRTRSGAAIRTSDGRIMNDGLDRRFVERRGRTRMDEVDIISRDKIDGEQIRRESGRTRIETYRPEFESQDRMHDARPTEVRRSDTRLRIEGLEPRSSGRTGDRDMRSAPSERSRPDDKKGTDGARQSDSRRTSPTSGDRRIEQPPEPRKPAPRTTDRPDRLRQSPPKRESPQRVDRPDTKTRIEPNRRIEQRQPPSIDRRGPERRGSSVDKPPANKAQPRTQKARPANPKPDRPRDRR